MDYDSDEYLQLDLKRIDVFLLMQRNSKQCCIVSSCVVYAITEPTVDTIIDCRFVIFMRETAVIPRLFHLEMHPFIY